MVVVYLVLTTYLVKYRISVGCWFFCLHLSCPVTTGGSQYSALTASLFELATFQVGHSYGVLVAVILQTGCWTVPGNSTGQHWYPCMNFKVGDLSSLQETVGNIGRLFFSFWNWGRNCINYPEMYWMTILQQPKLIRSQMSVVACSGEIDERWELLSMGKPPTI